MRNFKYLKVHHLQIVLWGSILTLISGGGMLSSHDCDLNDKPPGVPWDNLRCECRASNWMSEQVLYQYYDGSGNKTAWIDESWERPYPWFPGRFLVGQEPGIGSFNQGEDSAGIPGPTDANSYAVLEFQNYDCEWVEEGPQ